MAKDSSVSLSGLFGFARECLAAGRHPRDRHTFTVLTCPDCGVEPLALRIEHHTGSTECDFKGVIFGRCPACDHERPIFSFTGEHRKPVRDERPLCDCGHGYFLVANVERIEGDEGLPGYFDEGVIVGGCPLCGRYRAFVYTD